MTGEQDPGPNCSLPAPLTLCKPAGYTYVKVARPDKSG